MYIITYVVKKVHVPIIYVKHHVGISKYLISQDLCLATNFNRLFAMFIFHFLILYFIFHLCCFTLPVQSLPITTIVEFNPAHGEMYSI